MTSPIILPKDHYFLRHANDLDEILMPLKRFGITTFTFMRKFANFSQIYISNNASWVEDYYSNALFGQFISKPPKSYQRGYILWSPDSTLPVHSLPRERYDTNHGATFVKPYNEFTDFYFFSGSNSSTHLINLYINHTEIFEKFILYFQDRAAKIIEKANYHKIMHPRNVNNSIDYNDKYVYSQNEITNALKEMRVRKYKLKSRGVNNVVLTSRELDTIFCLIDGMTAKESATVLNLSQRTVETYFENIKLKLNCFTKSEILDILGKDGFPV